MGNESARRVALVTGGNRGIGLETCRQLAQAGLEVLLGSRDSAHGEQAAAALTSEGLAVRAVEVDVADEESVNALPGRVEALTGRLDALVNNAGVFLDRSAEDGASVLNVTRERLLATLEVNTLGALRVTQACVGLLGRRGGRIVNVSSSLGQLSGMQGRWPAYRISKTALNALTRMFADELRERRVLVNSVCPGWVRTDLGGDKAPRSTEQAADTIVWLSTLPDDGPSGGFWRDRSALEW